MWLCNSCSTQRTSSAPHSTRYASMFWKLGRKKGHVSLQGRERGASNTLQARECGRQLCSGRECSSPSALLCHTVRTLGVWCRLACESTHGRHGWQPHACLPQEAPLAHVHRCGAAVRGEQLGRVVACGDKQAICWCWQISAQQLKRATWSETFKLAWHSKHGLIPKAGATNPPGRSRCCMTACLRSATCSRTPHRSCTAARVRRRCA